MIVDSYEKQHEGCVPRGDSAGHVNAGQSERLPKFNSGRGCAGLTDDDMQVKVLVRREP